MNTHEVVFENGTVTISKAIKVGMLDDVNAAIDQIKDSKTDYAMVKLSLADLQYIRSLTIADAVSNELSGYNLRESLEYRRS